MSDWAEWCRRHSELQDHKDELGLEYLPRSFHISNQVYSAVMGRSINKLDVFIDYCATGLTEDNYCNVMQTVLQVEEAHEAISARKFDLFNQKVFFEDAVIEKNGVETTYSCFGIKVSALTKGDLFLMPSDTVVLHAPETNEGIPKNTQTISYKQGKIVKIVADVVLVPIAEPELSLAFLQKPLNISFISRGLIYDSLEQTLTQVRDDSTIKCRLLESSQECSSTFDAPKTYFSHLPNSNKLMNEFQQKAIKGILEARCRPKPYILFGPLGAGKTYTLALAIRHIFQENKGSRILFCTDSNDRVDDIEKKLEEWIDSDLIHKLIAGETVEENLNRLQSCPVHLSTNIKSLSLKDKFKYDYIFIDEVGDANELESLLPIGLLKDDGCLVLAGDADRNPVVKCKQLSEIGLGKSLLKRLFALDDYKRHPATNKYNDKYITKLLLNYKIDPRVIADDENWLDAYSKHQMERRAKRV